MKQPPRQKLTD
jgi:DIS3-like exonuclease 2